MTRHEIGGAATRLVAGIGASLARLKTAYPDLHVEDDKHGAVGFNVAKMASSADRYTVRREAERTIRIALDSYDALPPDQRTIAFKLCQENEHEREVRAAGLGKDFGITTFGAPAGSRA